MLVKFVALGSISIQDSYSMIFQLGHTASLLSMDFEFRSRNCSNMFFFAIEEGYDDLSVGKACGF